MADYTPPSGDEVDFSFSGDYTPPSGGNVNFLFGIVAVITVNSVSRDTIYSDSIAPDWDTSVIRWSSNVNGNYRMEMGGTGANTGDLLEAGTTYRDFQYTSVIEDEDITTASGFAGNTGYRFNIYVLSEDDIWSPYED